MHNVHGGFRHLRLDLNFALQARQARVVSAAHELADVNIADVRRWRDFYGKIRSDHVSRCDDLDHIDMSALSLMLRQRRDAVWDGLDICPRTCPSLNAKLCTYATWFARPVEKHARSLLDLPVSRRCMQRFLRFRMGCHRLPRDTGAWVGIPRLQRVCNICQHRTIGDEKALGV